LGRLLGSLLRLVRRSGLGGFRFRLLLGRLGLGLRLGWLGLRLSWLGFRLGWLGLGGSCLLGGLGALRTSTASLDLGDVLADDDRVLLVGEKLLEGAGFGGIDGDIDLRVEELMLAGWQKQQ
jgi:hypothetical protein